LTTAICQVASGAYFKVCISPVQVEFYPEGRAINCKGRSIDVAMCACGFEFALGSTKRLLSLRVSVQCYASLLILFVLPDDVRVLLVSFAEYAPCNTARQCITCAELTGDL